MYSADYNSVSIILEGKIMTIFLGFTVDYVELGSRKTRKTISQVGML